MEKEEKIFHSKFSGLEGDENTSLYDLLSIETAKPVAQHSLCTKDESLEFKPNYEKHYSPKRVQSKLKVETVKDIRALFEKDVFTYLASDLEQQQNYLLRKIYDGSSSEEKTRKIAIGLLNADKPISRSSWQMLCNINPERHNHSKQFVFWDGKCVQVNGSRGGKKKFINLKVKKSIKPTTIPKKSALKSRIGLLQNSLKVKFKPGPLGKKKFLDASHHKYQMGNIELVKLPPPVLEVTPAYGTVLEPTIACFVNNLRGEKGVISEKLAEFAVSVLGTAHNNTVAQLDENCCTTFCLNYNHEQDRVLMRQNVVEITSHTKHENESNTNKNVNSRAPQERIGSINDEPISEIKHIMNDMLDSVDISLAQESFYSNQDEPRDTIADDVKYLVPSRDKFKRKYCELDKLDVTIIKLPENEKKNYTKPCGNSFCIMGCICESLDCVFRLKQHCGIFDCMFGCKCELSKYKNLELLEKDCCDMLSGILNLDNQINSHLAKEEQKFHQTVIFSGDKSILLKSRKRNWESSKRYAEFYSKLNLKGDQKIKRVLSVNIEKLSCENIEPLCMVHNLYKCFCKGKFTETYVHNDTVINMNKLLTSENTKIQHEISTNNNESNKADPGIIASNVLRPRLRKTYTNHKIYNDRRNSANSDDNEELSIASARTMGFHGRKHSEDYYVTTNKKIMNMEQNDSLLKKKMLKLINGKDISSPSETSNKSPNSLDCETIENYNNEDSYNNIVNKTGETNVDIANTTVNKTGEFNGFFANAKGKVKFQNWLESSYKAYRERCLKGIVKNCLGPPSKGRASLQTWDFMLSRYRERKNIFVVTKKPPFRTFVALHDEQPFIANCLNIDDIRLADLSKYPIIVRNLVTNATEPENAFCILRGWHQCWELVGSAVKVFEKPIDNPNKEIDFLDTCNFMTRDQSPDNGNDRNTEQSTLIEPVPLKEAEDNHEIEQDMSSEKSKWFVLTVENDFTEIQFFKKGFYVTYEGIQRSINLARVSGKTVRLSSKARTDKTQTTFTHPYGIYAIPCTIKCCVFIGPYEEDETLGIEVVKTFSDCRRHKKTRGVWIKTNKVDNKNVIDNPLAYLPSESITNDAVPIIESGANTDINTGSKEAHEEKAVTLKTPEKEKSVNSKQVKPIKIRRTNGFYHLSPKNILKKIAMPNLFNTNSLLKNSSLAVDDSKEADTHPSLSNLQPIKEPGPSTSSLTYNRSVTDIKITHVYSERNTHNKNKESSTKNKESSMLVLKPEEINEKAALEQSNTDDLSMDIERFLETSTICIYPQEEILVISDGEDDMAPVTSVEDVWVQCCNVVNFGYIRAKINNDNALSFELPGFNYSEFYDMSEAFDKINLVLARKIYMPPNAKLQWEVIREKQQLTCSMLTPQCLKNISYLMIKLQEQVDYLQKPLNTTLQDNTTSTLGETPNPEKVVKTYVKKTPTRSFVSTNTRNNRNKKIKIIQGLEEASLQLEQQSAVLWKEAVSKRDEIFGTLSVPENLRGEMAEALQDIMALNDE